MLQWCRISSTIMDLASTLIERYFSSSAGELHIGAVPVSSLVAQYGTPLFVYDRGTIDRKISLLRDTLPTDFVIYYSVKANPNRAILRHFLGCDCGLEVASAGEFSHALRAGCPSKKILFAGPGKTEAELEFVLTHEIGEIHIESLLEAQRISAIGGRLGKRAHVAVRVNPRGEVQGGAMRMGGKPTPFGVDEEQLEEFINHLLVLPALDIRGIHLFTGTQILDQKVLTLQYTRALEIARSVGARLKHPLHTVDFGGGLGIPYFANDDELDMDAFRKNVAALMDQVRNESCFAGTSFIVEPGRYLIGEAGIYIARVNDIKISRGKKFLVLDGGMNHHLAASGNLGQVIKRNFPIAVINRLDHSPREVVDLVGPLCTPLDTLARDIEVPVARIGDLIGVFQSGAYGRSASPASFLSRPEAVEIWIDREKSFPCRPPERSGQFI